MLLSAARLARLPASLPLGLAARALSSYPAHAVIAMPSLSPTMVSALTIQNLSLRPLLCILV